MDRTKELLLYMSDFKKDWLVKKSHECKMQEEPTLIETAKKLLYEVGEKQVQGGQYEISCLSLIYFRSSVLTGTYRYQICVSDATLYMDAHLLYKEWIPEYLYGDVQILKKSVKEKLSKHFVRLTSYEIEFVTRSILAEYQRMAEVYWCQVSAQLIKAEEFQILQSLKNWRIFYGVYFDEMRLVLQSESRG